jgi:UDPglucose 6-dehydrogenase
LKIAVIGSGYVGLVTGSCLAQLGFSVANIDSNEKKIERLRNGNIPILEAGLTDLVGEQQRSGRLVFTSALAGNVKAADIAMIAVGTPSLPDGQLDLTAVEAVTKQLAKLMKRDATIVVKSTVPAGTCARLERFVAAARNANDVKVVSNPEFLREGSAVADFFSPDRIVIGASDAAAGKKVATLYDRFRKDDVPFVMTDQTTSELIKYAANGFLAMKITFINELAHLCNALNTDVSDLARGIGLDPRIGAAFLKPGPGYGGSCFPKDILALSALGQEANSPVRLIESVATANAFHVRRLLSQATGFFSRCWGLADNHERNFDGRRIAVLGLSFKANTDDIRDSASLVICRQLLRAGAQVTAYDPAAGANASAQIPELEVKPTLEDALLKADGVIIMTEWNEFDAFDWHKKGLPLMAQPIIVDFRNLLDPAKLRRSGFKVMNLGRRR